MCPTLRRTAGPARSHCLRSARTRRVGRARRDAGRCGAAQGCTQAVSASTTRATCPARSRQCALRSGAQQGPLDLTTCDQRGRDASAGRCGAVWDCRNGSSRAAEAPRQGRARAAQAARVPRAAAPPMALRRELAGEDERLAGRPPSVERVPHRDGAAASPTGARTARRRPGPERPRASACCWDVLRGR